MGHHVWSMMLLMILAASIVALVPLSAKMVIALALSTASRSLLLAVKLVRQVLLHREADVLIIPAIVKQWAVMVFA
jgi:hypothetical protein